MAGFRHLYGPLLSRRFGRSLGVDLQAPGRKVCTLNCLFCQLGPTAATALERRADVPIAEVLDELRAWHAAGGAADCVTLAGNGEPTLHPQFGEVLSWVRAATPFRALLLSNGSLFTLPEVRAAAAAAHAVKVSLHAWDAASFARGVRPHPDLDFAAIVEGYRRFREAFSGELIAEVFIVPGLNDQPAQAARIAALLATIRPDRIHLNAAVRPPAEAAVRAADPAALRRLAACFTPRAETPDDLPAAPAAAAPAAAGDLDGALADLVRRHPADSAALAATFACAETEVLARLQALAAAGRITLSRDARGRWLAGPP